VIADESNAQAPPHIATRGPEIFQIDIAGIRYLPVYVVALVGVTVRMAGRRRNIVLVRLRRHADLGFALRERDAG
jgi:hypothetical protein